MAINHFGQKNRCLLLAKSVYQKPKPGLKLPSQKGKTRQKTEALITNAQDLTQDQSSNTS